MLKAVAFDQDTGVPTSWKDEFSGNYIPDQNALNKSQEADWKEDVANQVEDWDPGLSDALRNQAETSREQVQAQIPAWNQMNPESYSTYNPWSGEFINDSGQAAGEEPAPAKLQTPNYYQSVSQGEDVSPADSMILGDGGYVSNPYSQETIGQAPNFQIIQQEIEDENKRQEGINEMYDYWGAPNPTGDNSPFVGDGGYLYDVYGNPGDASKAQRGADEYTGAAALDSIHRLDTGEWSGQKRTLEEMQRPYTDIYTARWYAEQPEFVDPSRKQAMHDYLDQIEKNTGSDATPVSKSELSRLFGFNRYEDGGAVSAANRLSDLADWTTNMAGEIAGLRGNNVNYVGTDSQGRRFDLNAQSDQEMKENLEAKLVDANGNELDMEATIAAGPDGYLYWGDVPLGPASMLQGMPNITIEGLMNVYGVRPSISTTLNGQVLNEEDIKMLTKDPILLLSMPSIQDEMGLDPDELEKYVDNDNLLNQLQANYGTGLDYGFLNWNIPQAHRSKNITDNLVNGNVANQFADLLLTSAPYFMPQTLVPMGASQVWQQANGVNSMGRDNQMLGTNANAAIAAPAQGLATVGESVLGGMAGRGSKGTGFNEWAAEKLGLGALNKSTNPLVNIAREGLYEGLEEVETNPLYNLAEYGDFDAKRELDDFWNNLAGGALVGAPMAAANEVKGRVTNG